MSIGGSENKLFCLYYTPRRLLSIILFLRAEETGGYEKVFSIFLNGWGTEILILFGEEIVWTWSFLSPSNSASKSIEDLLDFVADFFGELADYLDENAEALKLLTS